MFVLGVTGGSGSGKGVVCHMLQQKGAFVIDTDKLSRLVVEQGKPAYYEIVEHFGKQILDENGDINRKELALLVFSNKQALAWLTKVTHHYIIIETKALLDEKRITNQQMVVIDAPLLIEANLHLLCQFVLVVNASVEVRMQRIMQRDKLSKTQAAQRLENQMPLPVLLENLKTTPFCVIENNGTQEELQEKLNAISFP